jgi:hypothetical protein
MTIPEILNELELYTGRFPKRAMQAAIEQQEEITPELLRVLERAAEEPQPVNVITPCPWSCLPFRD